MIRAIILFLCMHYLPYHISLVNASPGDKNLKPHQIEDLLRELAFNRPIELEKVLENTLKLPDKAMISIFKLLNYAQVYEITRHLNDEIINPNGRTRLNPLTYHDAESEDQAALKEWFEALTKSDDQDLERFGFYLARLLENPTVFINTLDTYLIKQIIKVAASQRDPEVYKDIFTKLKSRCDNINLVSACKYASLDLITFLIDKGWIAKNSFALAQARRGENKEIIDFLEKEGVIEFQVQTSRYDQSSDVHLARHLQGDHDRKR